MLGIRSQVSENTKNCQDIKPTAVLHTKCIKVECVVLIFSILGCSDEQSELFVVHITVKLVQFNSDMNKKNRQYKNAKISKKSPFLSGLRILPYPYWRDCI